MSASSRRIARLPVLPATAVVGALILAGCSGDGSSSVSAASSSVASASSSVASPSSTGSSTSTPVPSSTAPSSPSSTAKAVPSVNVKLTKACLSSTAQVATATLRWNAALKLQKKSTIRSAAKNFDTTAASIRSTTKGAADKQYTNLIGAVAKDMETMSAQNAAGKATVSGTALSTDSTALAKYCQNKVAG